MTGLRTSALLALVALTACGDRTATKSAPADRADTGGTLVISAAGGPDNLMPPITTQTAGLQVEDLVFQRLATVGPALNTVGDAGFIPDLAQRWDWAADSLSITFHLDSAARWHDGTPVRAADVAFTFALYKDPKTAAPAATSLVNVDSMTVRDSLTVVAWFHMRTPGQFFDATMQMQVLPQHLVAPLDRATLAASAFASQPVGSGPFRFVRWVPNQSLELAADTTGGRRRARLDRVVFAIASDPNTAFTRLATGEADFSEDVRPDKVADVAANPQLRLSITPGLLYYFLTFNLVDPVTGAPHPIFGDRNVRRALTMATDRRAIVANVYDSLAAPARGPFTAGQASADTTLAPLPYAVDSAAALLDAAGWIRGADSLRRRNGKTLAFRIQVPTSSIARMRMAVLLQEQFRRIGADVTLESMDVAAFSARMDARRFDAMLLAWAQDGGPANARDAWSTASAAKGMHNYGAYRSPTFDAHIDSALAVMDPAAARGHFGAAWKIISADAPAIWLAEPRKVMAVHSRFVMTGARPDAWWAGIPRWYIPAAKRIARDVPAGATR